MQRTGRLMRELFSYIERFKGSRFVVKIDDALVSTGVFPTLVQDLAQLRKIGIELVVVAGARRSIDDVLDRYGIPRQMADGIRVSTDEAMPLIEMAAFDVATKIMTRLTGAGIDAVVGNWVRARTLGVVDGIDYLNTGSVEGIVVERIGRLVCDGIVPILPCIGWNHRGEPYNVSSNRLAADLATRFGAGKLMYCLARKPSLPDRMTTTEAERLIEEDDRECEEDRELVRLAVEACRGGVDRVHAVDATAEDAVLQEVFSNVGAGSMVYATPYDAVRPYRRSDAAAVLRIMRPYVESGRLLARTEADLERLSSDFVVYEIDGTVHGVAALSVVEDDVAEIHGIAIDETTAELGVGSTLLTYLLDRAEASHIGRVFALTTQAYDWFRKLGFIRVPIDELPESKRRAYDERRKSRAVAVDLPRSDPPQTGPTHSR